MIIKWILSHRNHWMVNSLRNEDYSCVPSFSPRLITIICSEEEKEVIQPFQAGINCQQMRINHKDTLKWRRRQQLIRAFIARCVCVWARERKWQRTNSPQFIFGKSIAVVFKIWGITFFDYDNHLSQFSGVLIIHSNKDLKSKLCNFSGCVLIENSPSFSLSMWHKF